MRLTQPLTVNKDKRFIFHHSNKGVPRGYDDCILLDEENEGDDEERTA